MFIHSLIAVLSIPGVSAHFDLDSPATRGFDEDLEQNASCGGFWEPSHKRSLFPLIGGTYQLNSHHAQAEVQVVFSPDGITWGQPSAENYTLTGMGTICLGIPDGAFAKYKEGDDVSMQIIYKSTTEGSPLYQCADLTLTSAAGAGTSGSCVNGTGVSVSKITTAPGLTPVGAREGGKKGISGISDFDAYLSGGSGDESSGVSASGKGANGKSNSATTPASWRSLELITGAALVICLGTVF